MHHLLFYDPRVDAVFVSPTPRWNADVVAEVMGIGTTTTTTTLRLQLLVVSPQAHPAATGGRIDQFYEALEWAILILSVIVVVTAGGVDVGAS